MKQGDKLRKSNRISTKEVQSMQTFPNWLEGIDLSKRNAEQYLKRYKAKTYYYWPKGKSYIFEWINATTCITRSYFLEYFNL